jgi:hypothetical protein
VLRPREQKKLLLNVRAISREWSKASLVRCCAMNSRLKRMMLQRDLVEADRHISEAEDRIARHTEHHNEAETDEGHLWLMEQSLLEKRKHRREILRSLDKLKSRSWQSVAP